MIDKGETKAEKGEQKGETWQFWKPDVKKLEKGKSRQNTNFLPFPAIVLFNFLACLIPCDDIEIPNIFFIILNLSSWVSTLDTLDSYNRIQNFLAEGSQELGNPFSPRIEPSALNLCINPKPYSLYSVSGWRRSETAAEDAPRPAPAGATPGVKAPPIPYAPKAAPKAKSPPQANLLDLEELPSQAPLHKAPQETAPKAAPKPKPPPPALVLDSAERPAHSISDRARRVQPPAPAATPSDACLIKSVNLRI